MTKITRSGTVPPDHLLPPGSGQSTDVAHPRVSNGRPADPDTIRADIEDTRARMTRTLDEIEGRLAHQKETLVARATLRGLRRTIGSEPWRSVAIAFVAGYVIAAIRD